MDQLSLQRSWRFGACDGYHVNAEHSLTLRYSVAVDQAIISIRPVLPHWNIERLESIEVYSYRKLRWPQLPVLGLLLCNTLQWLSCFEHSEICTFICFTIATSGRYFLLLNLMRR